MMSTNRVCTTLGIATALAIGALALPTIGAEKMDPSAQTSPEAALTEDSQAQDLRTLQGQVVNLQSFLTAESAEATTTPADQTDQTRSQAKASKDAPLGLSVREEGVISALTSEHAYLIIYAPGEGDGEDAYKSARDMIGKQVTITGRVVERASLSGIVIDSVKESTTGQASADDSAY